MLARGLSQIRRLTVGTMKETSTVKRRDMYSDDVFRVTDDGIKWSYEVDKSADLSSTKLKTAVYMSKLEISKLPVAVAGKVDRASILSQINSSTEVSA